MLINLRVLTQKAHLKFTFAAVPEEGKEKKKEEPCMESFHVTSLPYRLEYGYDFCFLSVWVCDGGVIG